MSYMMQLADGAKPCEDCTQYGAEWCCTMNCSNAELRPIGSSDPELTENWLADVGFKYREPGERQSFRHWTLQFSEWTDHGLYIETTMPGVINRHGEHVGKDSGWFVWLGREHKFMHIRHMYYRKEMVALVEAVSGKPWTPTKVGLVPFVKPQQPKPKDT